MAKIGLLGSKMPQTKTHRELVKHYNLQRGKCAICNTLTDIGTAYVDFLDDKIKMICVDCVKKK
jgi:hypothetical protein